MRVKTLAIMLTMGLLGSVLVAESTPPVDMQKRAEELKSLKWGLFVSWSMSTFSGEDLAVGVTDIAHFAAKDVDTDEWARAAKDAGMGYILFLSKHCDGFCLWDTKTTDWKVTKSPLGLSELLSALRWLIFRALDAAQRLRWTIRPTQTVLVLPALCGDFFNKADFGS